MRKGADGGHTELRAEEEARLDSSAFNNSAINKAGNAVHSSLVLSCTNKAKLAFDTKCQTSLSGTPVLKCNLDFNKPIPVWVISLYLVKKDF